MNLKIISYNIHKGIGWGIKRFTLSQIQHQLNASNCDIIFLQEIQGHQYEHLTLTAWPYFSYGKNVVYRKNNHGNAILSKFPILHTANIDISLRRFERRGMLHAVVKLPNHDQQLHLICVHLGLFEGDRRKQLNIMMQYINNNIPRNDLIILGGDFNDWRKYATQYLADIFLFKEAFVSTKNKHAKTFPAWMPMLSLDRLYFRGFTALNAECLSTKKWRFLSDHIPILVSLQTNEEYQTRGIT